jgi:hypothetical protein
MTGEKAHGASVTYKLCRVSAGRVIGARDIEAKTVEEAVATAIDVVQDEPAELWLGERLVMTIDGARAGRR